ncbi:MAG TPA: hypothetical protein VFD61_10350 [Gaiellales bacterium]|nr:hypothetical protein [Gaiellales bacterium]
MLQSRHLRAGRKALVRLSVALAACAAAAAITPASAGARTADTS